MSPYTVSPLFLRRDEVRKRGPSLTITLFRISFGNENEGKLGKALIVGTMLFIVVKMATWFWKENRHNHDEKTSSFTSLMFFLYIFFYSFIPFLFLSYFHFP
ncbi:hypothetical protein C7212DRAFT_313506, partial [Tuber magnatum]